VSFAPSPAEWEEHQHARVVALSVGGRYVALAAELMLGLFMLPFNTRHLGASEYGLWMLAASIVSYFPVLDLGYGGAMVRSVAQYRARRDVDAINETASTLLFVFAGLGVVAFGVMAALAWNLETLFGLNAIQARTGGIVMLLVAVQFAVGLPFAIFGAVVNGFQRTYLNSAVGTAVAVAAAAVNVAVILAGGGLVQLVAAMTATRMVGYVGYRLNAYRIFPPLQIRPSLFRVARLREVTRFSVYMLIQDASSRVNYAADPIVIAAVLVPGAVAVWTVAQRLADTVLQLTNQMNYVLFPIVVDCDSAQLDERLRELLVQGTRLSLATTLPVTGALALLSVPVVVGWTGPQFRAAATILQILALVVVVRVGTATAGTVLQGGGHHRLLALSNVAGAVVNVTLSVLLIRRYGLPGVAVATLIPVTVRALGVLIPVACARVGISIRRFVIAAIWPAVWPAALVLPALALARHAAGMSLGRAVLIGVAGDVLYALLFLGLAIDRDDRRRYIGKLRSIAGWAALEPDLEENAASGVRLDP
jgi:O-antigen/teichoic acid export membrane protein